MDYVTLGRSGMKVSRYILGTLTFAGTKGFEALGDINVGRAKTMIDMALDAGINAFDTANLYSFGDAEEVLGEAVAGRRDQVLLFSKARSIVGEGPNGGGASRHHLTAQLELTLRRMKTDWLDVYFIHQWDGETPIEETVETMSGFVKAGKIRYWGVSNYSGWALAKTVMTARMGGFEPPVTHQFYYTPEAREAEYELIPAGEELGVGAMVWSPLGQGLFSGKVKADGSAPEGTRQSLKDWKEPYLADPARFARVLGAIENVAAEIGRPVPQVTLAWVRGRPGIGSLVLGARTEDQFRDNLASLEIELTAAQAALIEEAGRPQPIYPFWHRCMWGMDRPTPAERPYLEGWRRTIGV